MPRIRLTKEFSFEMAHVLEGYDGPCREFHGHSYRLFVTVIGEPEQNSENPKLGMVMDFGQLKRIVRERIVERYDHALLMRRSPRSRELMASLGKHFDRIIETPYQPTCENMVADMAREIAPLLPEGVELLSIKLHETATSFAEWFRDDNPGFNKK